jgi:hypothetical protein
VDWPRGENFVFCGVRFRILIKVLSSFVVFRCQAISGMRFAQSSFQTVQHVSITGTMISAIHI